MNTRQEELYRTLRQAPLTCGLPDTDLDALTSQFKIKTVEAGKTLFRVGDQVPALHLVLTGKINFELGVIEGQSNHIGVIGPCEHFGDLEIISHRPCLANITVLETSRIALLPAPQFIELFQQHPSISQILALKFALLFNLALQIGAVTLGETVDKRLALLLLTLNDQLGTGDDANRKINVKLSQENIANMLGVTRQAISKPLAAFREQGWISIHNRLITLHNINALRKLAAFEHNMPKFGELDKHKAIK